jgi:hypothetical protein
MLIMPANFILMCSKKWEACYSYDGGLIWLSYLLIENTVLLMKQQFVVHSVTGDRRSLTNPQ